MMKNDFKRLQLYCVIIIVVFLIMYSSFFYHSQQDPSPSFNHQVIVNKISWHLNNYFRKKPCRSLTAPLDIRLFDFATNF